MRMRVSFLGVVAVLLFLLCSCDSPCQNCEEYYNPLSTEQDEDHDGMVRVVSTGHKTQLGTNNAASTQKERPAMRTDFSYDYSIGKHEVMCGEFKKLMDIPVKCAADSLPVVNVTYYDAVLYANARSKEEKYDTAYSYTDILFDLEGHVIGLDGFVFRPEVDAYRLPTEAEWILAATPSWNPLDCWNNENSNYKIHNVCRRKVNDLGLCDMAGNAMEWVNDWLGRFRDIPVENYVGAPDGGNLDERIVKGGSFRNSPSSMNVYSRGDVYAVSSATRADYVGFRLAFGKIPNATWMSSNGSASTSRTILIATSADVRSFTGTYRSKLAFRNDATGNLSYVDYSNGFLAITEIEDSLDVYHPEISPNGKRVAFCTGLEGTSIKSAVYVRDLNGKGSNLVKLDVDNAAIPRWSVSETGDTLITYVSSAGNNKQNEEFMRTSTWQVSYANGKFGTPVKLFDGAYHGGLSSDNHLAVTGARLLRARTFDAVSKAAKDEVWYNSEQACNASLTRDNSKKTLFLDFGGETGRTFTGVEYGTHEMLLVADSVGNLIQGIPSPSGYSFDHSEWAVGDTSMTVKGNGLVVASLTDANGAHTKLVLLNTADSSMIDLVEGEELWHPNLWVAQKVFLENGDTLNFDSAGVYYAKNAGVLLTYKMKLFWQLHDSLEIVALGSSRMSSGFIAGDITAGFTLNMACIPNDMDVIRHLAINYILPHSPKLKTLVVGLDLDLWSHTSGYNLKKNFGAAPGYHYDEKHGYWKDGVSAAFIENNLYSRVSNEEEYDSVKAQNGWVELECISWSSQEVSKMEITEDSTWSEDPLTYNMALEQLVEILDAAKNRHINVVGVVFPQSPQFRLTGAFGRHGMMRSHAENLLSSIQKLEGTYSNFTLVDENNMGIHSYVDSTAYDYDHLCAKGARKLTCKLDSLLVRLK